MDVSRSTLTLGQLSGVYVLAVLRKPTHGCLPFLHHRSLPYPPHPCSPFPSSKTLSRSQTSLYTSALLRFHFIYGDFIRWLSGEYTNRHRNWTKDFATMLRTASRPLTPDYPIPDYPRAFRINTEDVPFEGTFTTPASEIPTRDYYDNHPAVGANHSSVEAKFSQIFPYPISPFSYLLHPRSHSGPPPVGYEERKGENLCNTQHLKDLLSSGSRISPLSFVPWRYLPRYRTASA
jgi:hypothetical protein